MKRFSQLSFITFFIAVFFLSCSQSDPVIRSHVVQILRVQGPTGQFAERLSVFVFFEDDDGAEDLERITVMHEESGIFWTIRAGDAMTRSRGDDLWTGSNNLAGPGDRAIPSGAYSITVNDLAGKESVSTFRLTHPTFPDFSPYSFSITDGQWKLERNRSQSSFERVWLFLYDRDMKILYSWRVTENPDGITSGSVDQLRAFASDTAVVQCYTENIDGSAGVLLTPVFLE
jgi:hypothetical protein